jgi:hypothetical protein
MDQEAKQQPKFSPQEQLYQAMPWEIMILFNIMLCTFESNGYIYRIYHKCIIVKISSTVQFRTENIMLDDLYTPTSTNTRPCTLHSYQQVKKYNMLGWLPLMCNNHWQLQQLQLELHQPCAPIQDVKGWQPPLLNKSWSWQLPLLKKSWSWWHHSCL